MTKTDCVLLHENILFPNFSTYLQLSRLEFTALPRRN